MSDASNEPVTVDPNAVPALVTTLIRYVAAPIGGWLMAHGLIVGTNDPTQLVIGVLMSVVAAGWGLWRTWRNHGKLLTVASDPRVPDSVAQVK